MLEINEYLKMLVALLAIVDPLGNMPFFLSLTASFSLSQKNYTIKIAMFASMIIFIANVFVGKYFLEFFGITIESFQIAGGILLMSIAFSILNDEPKINKQQANDEIEEASHHKTIAIVPLAMPLIAGPGAVSLIIVYSNKYDDIIHKLLLCLVLLIIVLITYLVFKASNIILKKIGHTGISIINKVMGMILVAISVEFIAQGILGLFPGLR